MLIHLHSQATTTPRVLDRCLRRHGVGNLRDLQARAARPKHRAFKACEPG